MRMAAFWRPVRVLDGAQARLGVHEVFSSTSQLRRTCATSFGRSCANVVHLIADHVLAQLVDSDSALCSNLQNSLAPPPIGLHGLDEDARTIAGFPRPRDRSRRAGSPALRDERAHAREEQPPGHRRRGEVGARQPRRSASLAISKESPRASSKPTASCTIAPSVASSAAGPVRVRPGASSASSV